MLPGARLAKAAMILTAVAVVLSMLLSAFAAPQVY
jgi:hypothetical protein